MKKHLLFIVTAAILCALPEASLADSIKGRFGITGRLGLMVPSDSDASISAYTISVPHQIVFTDKVKVKADAAFVGGGGFIYGVTDNIAVEADVTHTPQIDYNYSGRKLFDITTTNVSLGLQYRFFPENQLVPYLGGGVDFIISDGNHWLGDKLDVETVMGGHVNAGVDFFVAKRIALNADIRGILAPQADVVDNNSTPSGIFSAKYDPISFVALFGVRFFLN